MSPGIAAGWYHSVGLKADGTAVAVGENEYGQCDISGWSDITAVSAGSAHTVGLKTDGTVVAAGTNGLGALDVSGWSDITAVSAGGNHTVGLKADGTVVAVGFNEHGQCDVSGWNDIVAVAGGWYHTLGLKSDGTVMAAGNYAWNAGHVSGWSDITAVSVGSAHAVGLKSDGTVVAVGLNGGGQCDVSGWSDITAVSAGGSHTVGLKSDGTVVAAGVADWGQCDVTDWRDVVAVACGTYHTVGLKSDGTVVATGEDGDGQCDVARWNLLNVLPGGFVRVAGPTRYETAIEASKRAYPSGADTVVIATGQNWPDALGGAALAGAVDGPLLLTKTAAVPGAVLDEIERLGAVRAYVLGGDGAIGPAVLATLRAELGEYNVIQLQGPTRYETAQEIAVTVLELKGSEYDGLVLVSRGDNYPDALAGSPIAAAFGAPILLAKPGTPMPALPAVVTDAAILGSSDVVSSDVEDALAADLGNEHVRRFGGATRYETAALIASWGVDQGLSWNGAGIATGQNFPDALSGGAMLGRFGSVMLLTPTASLHPAAAAALTENAADIDTVFFLGDASAVNQSVQDAIALVVQ